jgi:hypothetical protein
MRRKTYRAAILGAFAAALAIGTPSSAVAQKPEDAVVAVVHRMFEGMRTADSAMVRSAFATGARFAMVDARQTPPVMRYMEPDGWIKAIATSNRTWDEQVYDVVTKVDGGIAHVWAPYTFYLNKAVRHCGVNTIELIKIGDEWKVTQLSDSQRRENCPDPLKK